MDTSTDLKKATSGLDGAPVSRGETELVVEHNALEEYIPGTKAEKRLLRKVDFIMVPSLWFMCVMAYLDRNNIVSLKGVYFMSACCS